MKKTVALIILLMLVLTGCNGSVEEESNKSEDTVNWYEHEPGELAVDDTGDADLYDIKKVYVNNDDEYIYISMEVTGDDIDATTMINGGECVFITIDTPDFFWVETLDDEILADNEGNGNYTEEFKYMYEDDVFKLRAPLSVFDGAKEVTINSVFRENSNGEKSEADELEDFKYMIK